MDIAALSVVSAQTSAQNAASIMLMRKTMDTMEQNGQGVINLLQSVSPAVSLPHLGNSVDISI